MAATEKITGRVQFPMFTAAALAAANPVLLKGEVVYESDTRRRKIGDGVTAWKSLPYESDGEMAGSIHASQIDHYGRNAPFRDRQREKDVGR